MDSGSPCRVLGADDVDTPGLGVGSGVLAPGQKVALQPSRNNSTPEHPGCLSVEVFRFAVEVTDDSLASEAFAQFGKGL